MYFNSIAFLVFFPVFLVCFFAARGRVRLGVSLVGSYIFYGWWDVRFLSLIVASTLIDFYVGRRLDATDDLLQRKRLVAISLISNLGMLFSFKYFNFFRDSLVDAFSSVGITLDWPTVNIIVPVGISFYTFQTLSYTIDIYRRSLSHEPSLLRFAVYVSFFPQLVAGPIVRASNFLPQLSRDTSLSWRNFVVGSSQITAGFFKKCVIADSVAPYVDAVFASPETQSSATVVVGVLFYAFQIYCDFSGYSDIAIGLARVLGYRFPQNFRRPYFATSFSDFWQRWHISLSSWLRDYLYISLGGNRRGVGRTYVNLMLTMLLGGLWHGAAWTFVVWGLLHGFYLVVQRLIVGPRQRAMKSGDNRSRAVLWAKKLLCGVVVFMLVCIAWVFFRASDFQNAALIFERIAALDRLSPQGIQNKIIAAKGISLIGLLVVCDALALHIRVKARVVTNTPFLILYFCVMLWGIAWLGTFDNAAFIYFQF